MLNKGFRCVLTWIEIIGGCSELFIGEVSPRGFRHKETFTGEAILRGRERELWLLATQVFTCELVTCEERNHCEASDGLLLDGFNHFGPLETM